ncbi:MAG: hypothetical protein DSO00_01190 [Archaeoglobi archaeon]|nr:MAG: hypothetical protein DSO00_01190 [Archaeoglobi archaeon]
MDVDIQKIVEEKDKKIEELQSKLKELEKKLRYYEIKEIYQGLIPEDLLKKLMDLPPEIMVIEIGRYLREKNAEKTKSDEQKVCVEKDKLNRTLAELKIIETKLAAVKAKVGVDLNFTQRFDFEGSEVAFLSEDIMKSLGVSEDDYIIVQKDGSVTLRVIPYSKPGFVIVPTWVREKIGAKVNDVVEVVKK